MVETEFTLENLPDSAGLFVLLAVPGQKTRLVAAGELFVTERRACELLGLHRSDLYRYRTEGLLRYCHPPGSTSIRYRVADLLEFSEKWKGANDVTVPSPRPDRARGSRDPKAEGTRRKRTP